LINAVQIGDSVGVEALGLPRVKIGTKVLVMNQEGYLNDANVGGLPCDGRGGRVVRILEGEHKGKQVIIPARNLRLLAEMKPAQPKPERPKPAATPSSRAKSLLRSAQNLEKMEKLPAALKDYRQIIADFPDSPEAKTAAERLKKLDSE
jgi:hypothetical protein